MRSAREFSGPARVPVSFDRSAVDVANDVLNAPHPGLVPAGLYCCLSGSELASQRPTRAD